ncbi:MAG: class I SAM-dependent methyltransferase, partial [Thermomicrobiales bacterium]
MVGDPVLEVGSGTGRVLAPLADAGHRVTGLDASKPMLARARRRLVDVVSSGQVQLVEATFADVANAPGGPFGLAIVALNGFLHANTATAQLALLREIGAALDPRGMLVLDVLNPTPAALQALDLGVVHEGSWQRPDRQIVAKFASRTISPAEQRIVTDLWYDHTAADGLVQRTVTRYAMRWVHRAELELMLELAGYAEWHIYGSYELDPFEDGSDRMVVTAEVTRS